MPQAVKGAKAPRTRRAEQSERTRRRILDAATSLFAQPGYAATTIEAIATQADVAVETVYSRFRNKANLLEAILEPAIVGVEDGRALFDLPEFAEIRSSTVRPQQVALLAHFSRMVLERTDQIHRIIRRASGSDPKAAELERVDRERRYRGQRLYIDVLLAGGPLRPGLSADEAADVYASLANPETYAFLTGERGWTPERFETWLADSVNRLLLP